MIEASELPERAPPAPAQLGPLVSYIPAVQYTLPGQSVQYTPAGSPGQPVQYTPFLGLTGQSTHYIAASHIPPVTELPGQFSQYTSLGPTVSPILAQDVIKLKRKWDRATDVSTDGSIM